MAACDLTRPLTQAQLEAGFGQQRTGVGQALRPFTGSPTVENLLDYINRELVPVLRATRNAANDVWKQVVDNAPSANPLAFYFSSTTTNADPTAGRVRLNQAVQNTATAIRVSESNGRLQSVQPWLDVMSGGPTSPLGTVTILDAINPGRFLRFDLNTMTDQGAYWDLGVTFIEGSDASPFVDDEAVTIGFIAGVSAAGSTVPVGSLSPVAPDTFLGNISGGVAAPAAVPFTSVDSTSIAYDTTAHELRRAALTGDVTASANANATTIANNAVTNAKAADMAANTIKANPTAGTVDPQDLGISVDNFPARLAGNLISHPFATLAGSSLSYTAGSGALVYLGNATGNDLGAVTGAQGVVSLSGVACGGCVTVNAPAGHYTIAGFDAPTTDGFWFDFCDRSTSGTNVGVFLENSGATTTSIRTPAGANLAIIRGQTYRFTYQNSRWRVLGNDAHAVADRYASLSSLANSTSPVTVASLSIPPSFAIAGTCVEFFGSFSWTRGPAATAVDVTMELKINGTQQAFYTTRAITTSGLSGDASVHGFFNFLSVGATGSLRGRLSQQETAPFGATTTQNGIIVASIDTTSAITVAVDAFMSGGVANVTLTGTGGLVQLR